jgi:hypothetical protein
LDRPPRASKGSEALAGSNSPFDGTVVLLRPKTAGLLLSHLSRYRTLALIGSECA